MITIEAFYKGRTFELFVVNESGKCFVTEFIDELKISDQKKIIALLKRAGDLGTPSNPEKFKNLDVGLWEFKSHQIRILCTFDKGRIILLTHGFIKKKGKTPKAEIERARRLLKDYYKEREGK